jgi:ribosomal protein S6
MSQTIDTTQLSEDARPRIYEAGILYTAALGDEGVSSHHTALIEWIKERGGEIIMDGGMPERFDLAYPMSQIRENKRTNHIEAYLGWFKFIIDSSIVREFEDALARDMNVIRKIVFKTVRENTYIQRKSPRKREAARSAEEFLVDETIAVASTEEPREVVKSLESDGEVDEAELTKKLEELSVTE